LPKVKESPRTSDNYMTSFVLTLIGNAESAPLESAHIKRVFQCLELNGETEWLAEREACDLFINSQLSAELITNKSREALTGCSIDAVCTLAEGRRKRLLISDMDSTVINQECIDELADAMGLGSQIREITASVIQGDISFSEALRKRLGLMKGMESKILESVYEQRISLKTGARTMVQTMRHHGAFCILVSGGFTYFTSRIASRLGFHSHQGNELIFSDGMLTGEVQDPILGRSAKLDTLMSLCGENGLTPADVLAVGDGANDIKMIQAAGLGVAFHDTGSLREQANAFIEHGDLSAILYIQGFHKSEFVLT
jgi:phosphoserine phosphatase